MRGRVVFRFAEDFSPLRIAFRPQTVVVEDGDLRKPDLVIAGRLPDIVHFATVPTLGGRLHGVPDPRAAPRPRGARPPRAAAGFGSTATGALAATAAAAAGRLALSPARARRSTSSRTP